jgi:HEAT repeats
VRTILKGRRSLIAVTLLVIVAASIGILLHGVAKRSSNTRSNASKPTVVDAVANGSSPTNLGRSQAATTTSARLDRAKQIIRDLRNSAAKTNDVQALCFGNAALLAELRDLGPDALTAALDEVADKSSPQPLRILLIEIATHLVGHRDDGMSRVLMAIITDPQEAKPVKMQALQWIPAAGTEAAGPKLLEMLSQQGDPDLEFGIARALGGFRVPGSVGALQAALGDDKSYLTRIAAAHALAKQGGPEALTVLQRSVTSMLAKGVDEAHPEQNAIAVHAVLALGEIPDAGSLPTLDSVLNDSANSIPVRNKAAEVIGKIGGPEGAKLLRSAVKQELDESVLAYIARGLALCGEATDAELCLKRAAMVSDTYTRNQLERAAGELQSKARR